MWVALVLYVKYIFFSEGAGTFEHRQVKCTPILKKKNSCGRHFSRKGQLAQFHHAVIKNIELCRILIKIKYLWGLLELAKLCYTEAIKVCHIDFCTKLRRAYFLRGVSSWLARSVGCRKRFNGISDPLCIIWPGLDGLLHRLHRRLVPAGHQTTSLNRERR